MFSFSFSRGAVDSVISGDAQAAALQQLLEAAGPLRRVLLLPPDFTRFHSGAGAITVQLYEMLQDQAEVVILPALGTHAPMSAAQLNTMFPGIPHEVFRPHDWRNEVVTLGEVPARFVADLVEGRVDYPIQAEVNRLLVEEEWDLILSIGQVVPHEVIGMANHNKNVFVGTGGSDTINKTHYLSAIQGIESVLGQPDTAVRRVLNYADDHFLQKLPLAYLLTVRGYEGNELVTRGLYIGAGRACFEQAAALASEVNIEWLDERPNRLVVYLEPGEFHSTWLGNKAIYRTRLAAADDAELIILAPGLTMFGEDPAIDQLIRKYGYRGTPATLQAVADNEDLRGNLSAAAHLIHGSTEGRFRVRYATGGLSREEIESVGYEWGDSDALLRRYDPATLRPGWNEQDGERFYFIRNPATGLWAYR